MRGESVADREYGARFDHLFEALGALLEPAYLPVGQPAKLSLDEL